MPRFELVDLAARRAASGRERVKRYRKTERGAEQHRDAERRRQARPEARAQIRVYRRGYRKRVGNRERAIGYNARCRARRAERAGEHLARAQAAAMRADGASWQVIAVRLTAASVVRHDGRAWTPQALWSRPSGA